MKKIRNQKSLWTVCNGRSEPHRNQDFTISTVKNILTNWCQNYLSYRFQGIIHAFRARKAMEWKVLT